MRKTSDSRTGDARVAARNFACAVETPMSQPLKPSSRSTDSSDRHGLSCVNDHGEQSSVWYNRVSRPTHCDERSPQITSSACASPSDVNNTQQAAVTSSIVMASHVGNDTATFQSARTVLSDHNDFDTQNLIVDGLSKLNYVPVRIQGIDDVHYALNDSGSEINLIHRNLVQRMDQLPSRGRVKIKGIVGPAVETDIVLLNVSPVATEAHCVNIAPPLSELFAVCDDLNEQVILTADTVNRLLPLKCYESLVIAESPLLIPSETCDNAEPVRQEETVAETHYEIDSQSTDTVTLINEQKNDPMLEKYFGLVRQGHKQFFIRDGLLFRRGKVNGNHVDQLCLPQGRIETVLKLAHDMPASGHQAVRRTNDRIAMSFYFPCQWQRVKTYCDSCEICQMRARERRTDLVPIQPIERHEENFGHLQADIIGPMGDGRYKYALVLTDIQSRYVTAFELSAPSARNVVDKIILHSSYFGLPRYISFDCGTHFTSELSKVCSERLGVSPRFHCPYNPRAAGIVERSNATVKQIISKLAADHPSSWHKILPFALWCLRTSVNETLGIAPFQAVFGRVGTEPMQLLCDDWIGKRPYR